MYQALFLFTFSLLQMQLYLTEDCKFLLQHQLKVFNVAQFL